jgi:protein involved in polysaccharide export with SLBB domain
MRGLSAPVEQSPEGTQGTLLPQTTAAPSTLSRIEALFQGNFADQLKDKTLEQFGYNLFTNAPNDFSPLQDVPVNNEYIVGPGDTFTINVWGSANFSHTVTVRRDGTIFIPKIGTIKVFGDSFQTMSSKIEKRLSSFFSGIKMNIAFENVRSIDVFVVGEVNRPGSYTVPSTSAVLNVLFHAGGPTKSGSLRKVQLVRRNETIATIDLYDFLINGANHFQKLQSQDVILVPVIGPVAAVAGQVRRPGIYELTAQTNLFDLMKMAGDLSFTGEAGRIEFQRVAANQERIVKDFKLPDSIREMTREQALETELAASVQDGDLAMIFPVQPEIRRSVFLRGHVKRPGGYEFREGMKVSDIIRSFDDLLAEPYTQFIQISRIVPPKDERQALFVSLADILAGKEGANAALQERDEIRVYSKQELNLLEKVDIQGKVNKPGTFFYFSGMRLRDLIFMAGNVTQDAHLGNAEIARYQMKNNQLALERKQVNLADTLKGVAEANPVLMPKDRVFIQGISNWGLENHVTLQGEVLFPGKYPFLPGERLSSVLERAGGFGPKAFLRGAVFNRQSVRQIQERSLQQQITQLEEAVLQEAINPGQSSTTQDRQTIQEAAIARRTLLRNLQEAEVTGRMVIRLEELKRFRGSSYDIALEPNDMLILPPTPSVVTVMGEVYNGTSIIFTEGRDVQHYLNLAGGPTINADRESIFLIRADGTVISRQQNRGFLLKNFFQTRVERGDTILVPKDISRFSWLATTKDITEVLFKIASTTGITIQAFK